MTHPTLYFALWVTQLLYGTPHGDSEARALKPGRCARVATWALCDVAWTWQCLGLLPTFMDLQVAWDVLAVHGFGPGRLSAIPLPSTVPVSSWLCW